MQLLYNIFYRQYGLRRLQSLIAPKLFILNNLPRDSVVHYVSYDEQHPDIDTSKLYFGQNVKRIFVDYPEELKDTKNSSGRKKMPTYMLAREFHVKNKKFKFLRDHYQKINDPLSLFVFNYGYLNLLYRYLELPIVKHSKWWNVNRTVISKIIEVSEKTNKNNFIFVDLPEVLPSWNFLNMFMDKTTTAMVKLFDEPGKLFILEFWKWLSVDHRANSIFQDLKEEDYNKVNIVFNIKDGRSCVLNLGYINSWIKGKENTTEFSNINQIESRQLQKLFLKLLIILQSNTIQEQSEEVVETQSTSSAVINQDSDEDLDDDDEVSTNTEPAVYVSQKKPESKLVEVKEEDLNKALVDNVDMNKLLEDIDGDIRSLEIISNKKLQNQGVAIDKTGEIYSVDQEDNVTQEEIKEKIFNNRSFKEDLLIKIDEAADVGTLSASDYKKVLKDVEESSKLKDPYGSGKTIVEACVVTEEDIAIKPEQVEIVSSPFIKDKGMLKSTLISYDRDYISKVASKDVLSMVTELQRSGVIVRNHEIEIDNSALGSYENHTVELKPIDGQVSTLRFRIPKVNSDGTFVASGNKYLMRKQRVDVPIRKINPNEVQLTSYYGKTFVTLSDKKANSSLEWLTKELNKISLEMEAHPFYKKIAPADVFDNNFKAPYIYSALSHRFKSIQTADFTLVFDHSERHEMVSPELLEKLEKGENKLVGFDTKRRPIVVDKDNQFFVYSDGVNNPLGDIFQLLKLNVSKAPVDFTEVRVFSKSIPVGVILGYFIGFKNLLKFLNAKYRIVEGRKQKNLEPYEYSITFNDISYILSRKDRVNSMILSGFLEYEKEIKKYESKEFNNKDVYLNLLQSKGLGSLYVRELELSDQLFVDPITRSILTSMNEPVTFKGLLIRSTEILQTYYHPDPQDMSVMRIRGYERISGAIYKELTASIRSFRNRNISGKSKIEMSPYQIWSTIMKDPAIKLAEDINPLQNLKESEIVTYVGQGGRTKESMSKPSRAYHVNEMGITSEATVDSSDVGINAYLSADPNFKNLRGIPVISKNLSSANLVSTSALLAPGVEQDDGKRVNFISIQNSHVIAIEGARQPYVRTGYEYVMSSRTNDIFAYNAQEDGKVISLNENGIIVEYASGEKKGITLGRIFGKAEGSIYPHDIVTNLKLNQKFKKGDNIAYNTGFFEQDILDPSRIILKTGFIVKTALYESNQTYEDSSAISKSVSLKMSAKTTKVKSLVVNFNQNIINPVKAGQEVHPKDLLMIIEDEITSNTNAFDEESLIALRKLSNHAPRANYLGVVDKIEVFYHGDKADMSASLRALTDKSDKYMTEMCKASNKPVINGQVNDDYRVGGVPLSLDKAEIKIYITINTPAGVGDKGIFASQAKSVIGEVMDYTMTTESGDEIEAVFGSKSVFNRMINSPFIIGTTTTLLKVIAKQAASIYKK